MIGDLVHLMVNGAPHGGQIVAITAKRVRVALRNGNGYCTVLRKITNLKIAKKAKRLI